MAKNLYLVCGPNGTNWIVKVKTEDDAKRIVSENYRYQVEELFAEMLHKNCVPVILNKATVSFSHR